MAPPADAQKSGLSNLHIRLISAAVLLPVAIGAIVLGYPWFNLLVAAFAAAMAWEWTSIIATVREPGQTRPAPAPSAPGWRATATLSMVFAVLAVWCATREERPTAWEAILCGSAAVAICSLIFDRRRTAWYLAGVLYVAVPAVALILSRGGPDGLATIGWMVGLVVAADTGGYIAGRSIGGPKLAPRISPNKTWAGLGGAVLGAAIVGLLTGFIVNHTNVWVLALLSAALGLVEQAGDLVESAFKRHFGVKDASHIIPGHGGVLDRVDGLLAVAVAVLVIGEWTGRSVLTWS